MVYLRRTTCKVFLDAPSRSVRSSSTHSRRDASLWRDCSTMLCGHVGPRPCSSLLSKIAALARWTANTAPCEIPGVPTRANSEPTRAEQCRNDLLSLSGLGNGLRLAWRSECQGLLASC